MYSRATTSEMAERDFLPVCLVCFGVVEGLSLGIAAVLCDGYVGDEGYLTDCGCQSIKAADLELFEDDFRVCARD